MQVKLRISKSQSIFLLALMTTVLTVSSCTEQKLIRPYKVRDSKEGDTKKVYADEKPPKDTGTGNGG